MTTQTALAVGPLVARARATLTVDPAAVAANVRLLAARARGELMAVVKADGFGHGAELVARTSLVHGAGWLGVAGLDEAHALRAVGISAPLLSWLNPVDADWRAAVADDVDVAIASTEHLGALLRATEGARVHLQLDTGLARDGAEPRAWASLCRTARLAEVAGRLRVVGVMGHLACADDPTDPSNAEGRARFEAGVATARALGLRPRHRHLAATAATVTDPRTHYDLVRVGAGLVGIDPSGTTTLRGAMTLTTTVVEVRRVPAGTAVGYGHAWRTPRATTLVLLPVGYADGVPRASAGPAEVLLRGRRRPVVGRVSMDQVVLDVGDEPVRPGETATVFGPGDHGEPTVAEWAAWSGTIPHEIVTGIGSRVARRVAGSGS